jgi:hypothetical protein
MAAPPCLWCGGRRWVRYFSETTDGDFEEAFRLCPCNHKPVARGEDRREEPECAKNTAREKPASRCIGVIELRVELW